MTAIHCCKVQEVFSQRGGGAKLKSHMTSWGAFEWVLFMFAFRSFFKFHLNIPNEFTQNMPSNNLAVRNCSKLCIRNLQGSSCATFWCLFWVNFSTFLVRWLFQRTLVPAFFFYLLSFAFLLFTCNFMWFIKLRVW